MIIEVREYVTLPGRRDDWVAFMNGTIVPFMRSHGIVVLGQFLGHDDPNSFVWMRQFSDSEERERLTAAVYRSDEWQQSIGPRVRQHLASGQSRVRLLEPVNLDERTANP